MQTRMTSLFAVFGLRGICFKQIYVKSHNFCQEAEVDSATGAVAAEPLIFVLNKSK